jgi:hypothetical protein
VRYEGTCAKCWSFCCCCVTYYCTVRDQRADGNHVELPLETEVNVLLSQTDARQLRWERPTTLTGTSHALIVPPTQNTASPQTKGLTNRNNITKMRMHNSRACKTTPQQREAMLQSPKTIQLSFRTKNGLVTPVISTWTCLLCTFDNKQAKTACEICRNERSPTKRAIGNEALGASEVMKRSTTGNAGSSTDSNEGSSYCTSDYRR